MTGSKPKPTFGTLLLAGTLLVSVIMLGIVARFMSLRRQDAVTLAESQGRNLAHSMDQSLTGTLRSIDLALSTVVGELERDLARGDRDTLRLERFLVGEERLIPEAEGIWVSDASGARVLGKETNDPGTRFADRPYFVALKEHPGGGMVLSKPILGHVSKQWIIVCARPYRRPNGEFAGAVLIPVSIKYLQSLLAGFDLGKGGTLVIRDGDGDFITRFPVPTTRTIEQVGGRAVSPRLQGILHSGVTQASFLIKTPSDGVWRTFTFRRLPGFHLAVLAGLAEDDYLAKWRKDRIRTLLLSGLFLTGFWLMACLLWREWTGHMRDTRALGLSEERFRLAMEATSDGLWDWNVKTGAVEYSPAYARMLGYEASEFLQKAEAWANLIHPEDRARVLTANQECVENLRPQFEVEYRLRAKDGEWKWILGRGKAVHREATGQATRMLGTHVDITERKRAEEAQRHAHKLESLGVLAGGIAHDFNNLLTAIMGNLNLAQARVGEAAPASPYLDKMERTVLKAAELSRQMLAYSGKGHFVIKPRNLNTIVQEMAGLLAATLPKKLRLDLDLAPALPMFKADGTQIQQVVMNLITNAAEAIGNQEGTIALTTFHAHLDPDLLASGFPGQALEAGNYLILSVADSGCGMSPSIQSMIFDPFFTTKASGRGLGLSAMLGILKGHKAGIRIQSEVGLGTTFEIVFPAMEGQEVLEAPGAEPRETRLAGTVLLVDDEEIILDSTTATLEALGFSVIQARDGVEALERFSEHGQTLALVFMDLSMPRMDGASAFLAMRRALPAVPVVLTSGYDRKEATEDLLAQGLAGFVQKPYRLQDLARELGRVLAAPTGP